MMCLMHLKTALLSLSLALCLLLSVLGCKKESRSTRIFGRVIDNTQQPVANVQILIDGEKAGGLSKGDVLQTLVTDKQGLYSTTVIPATGYSGLQVINRFFNDPMLADKYKRYTVLYNGQGVSNCCPAIIGGTAEYNFTLVP